MIVQVNCDCVVCRCKFWGLYFHVCVHVKLYFPVVNVFFEMYVKQLCNVLPNNKTATYIAQHDMHNELIISICQQNPLGIICPYIISEVLANVEYS